MLSSDALVTSPPVPTDHGVALQHFIQVFGAYGCERCTVSTPLTSRPFGTAMHAISLLELVSARLYVASP